MGLVNGVYAKPQLESEVLATAETIAANAPLTLRAAKLAALQLKRAPAERDTDAVRAAIARCYASADYREGVAAFLAKRPADFKGK